MTLTSLFTRLKRRFTTTRADESAPRESERTPDQVVRSDGGVGSEATAVDDAPGTPDGRRGGADETGFPVDFRTILDNIGTPLFVLDADHDIVAWNAAIADMTGHSEAEAKAKEMASQAFYPDGRRGKTLADKVLEAPESAHTEFDVPLVEDAGFTLYRDTSVMTDADGNDLHISFSASPLYDDDGELVGAVEMVQDRTEDARRHDRVTALVDEIQSTMESVQAGDLGARATFEADEYVDDELLTVVESLNEMTSRLEELLMGVDGSVEDLRASADDVADTSQQISEISQSLFESMQDVSGEVANVSATVEEVASSAEEVAATSENAEHLAEDGYASAQEVKAVMEDITDSSEAVAADVEELRDRVEEIDDIVEVINDIAGQTNLLALNANIEAARAGEAGEGFAVVADEVKSLAEESQQHAEEIEATVDAIQRDTADTVESLSTTNRQLEDGIESVAATMERLSDVVDAVQETARGIEEVAEATDDGAASTEEVAAMVDEATERTERVSAEVRSIAEENEAQLDRVRAIDEMLARFVDE